MPSDASLTGHIKLYNLLNYFQDTAELAVEGIEGKSSELSAEGYAWEVTRYEISRFRELPKLSDEFTISTYHDPHHSYNCLRMFHVKIGGIEILRAKTAWVLVDLNKGKPVKPIAHLPEITTVNITEIDGEFHDIPRIIKPTLREKLHVKYHDTDYNGHVNHAIYFRWIFDLLNKPLRRIYASFRNGAKLGEQLIIEQENNTFEIIKADNEKLCASFLIESD